jgi:photosystem II stability/assembly factor-like uncharacterized protein
MYASSARSDTLLVGTKNGVALLERQGDSGWRVADQGLPGQHISAIVVEPESGLIFAGAFFGSVYASADGGHTWEARDRGIAEHDVYSLAWKRHDGHVRLFAGTQPARLFISDDLGLIWSELPGLREVQSVDQWWFPAPPHVAHTKFISFDPQDPHVVFACIEQGALLKSDDDGQTWRELNTLGFMNDKTRKVENFYDVHKLAIDPRDPDRLYVSGGAGLYVSEDRGTHWERRMSPGWASDVYPDGLVLNPRRPDLMFVGAAEHNPSTWHKSRYAGGKIFRTLDGGKSWETLGGGFPEESKDEVGALCLEDWGDGFGVYAATTGGEVYASEDGGDHWSLIASGLGAVSKKGHESLLVTA